jgi:hypothetical protein
LGFLQTFSCEGALDPDFLAEARKSEIGNILMIDRGYAGCAT